MGYVSYFRSVVRRLGPRAGFANHEARGDSEAINVHLRRRTQIMITTAKASRTQPLSVSFDMEEGQEDPRHVTGKPM